MPRLHLTQRPYSNSYVYGCVYKKCTRLQIGLEAVRNEEGEIKSIQREEGRTGEGFSKGRDEIRTTAGEEKSRTPLETQLRKRSWAGAG